MLSWTPILPLDLFNYIYLIFRQIIQPINHINPTFFSRAQSCMISCERISAKLPSWSQTFLCVYKNGYIASSPLLFQRKTCIDIQEYALQPFIQCKWQITRLKTMIITYNSCSSSCLRSIHRVDSNNSSNTDRQKIGTIATNDKYCTTQ